MATDEKLTQAAGLGPLIEAFDRSRFREQFKNCLPSRTSPRSQGSYRLGLIQLSSFIYGHDCMDDLEEFDGDPTLEAVMKGEIVAPRTMGDFLRDFEDGNCKKLNEFLSLMGRGIYKQFQDQLPIEYKPGPLQISIDSTSHPQCGEKIEGVEFNYKDEWCLDSQVVYDQMGICRGMQLREGSAKSGRDAEELIKQSFGGISFSEEKYLSGDAAYCEQDIIKLCMSMGVFFTLTANHATTGWEDHIEEIEKWEPWEYTQDETKLAVLKKKTLPQIELGRFLWQPSWSETLRIPIVVKRTWVSYESKKKNQPSLFDESGDGNWEYYGVVTSMPLIKFKLQDVIERHNKRGNAENFIREEKYGYDLKHFPCLKLRANYAYGMLALVAHNVLRWLSVMERPHKPHFSKKLRRRFVYIPGKLVKHARQLILKVPQKFYEEVTRLRQALQLEPSSAVTNSS